MARRVVLDTNILVSAILTGSEVSLILDWAIRYATILTSMETIREAHDVIMRPKFDNYVSQENRILALERVKSHMTWVPLDHYPNLKRSYCQDPKDDVFFQLALAGRADWLISGDKHILRAKPVEGVCVLGSSKYYRNIIAC